MGKMFFGGMSESRHQCSEQEEQYQEPEEGRPGMYHVDHRDQYTGEDAAGCEFPPDEGIGDETGGPCDLRDAAADEC